MNRAMPSPALAAMWAADEARGIDPREFVTIESAPPAPLPPPSIRSLIEPADYRRERAQLHERQPEPEPHPEPHPEPPPAAKWHATQMIGSPA